MKIAVLASGNGSNLQAIIDAVKNKLITNCEIEMVISNKESAFALERARKENIKAIFLNPKSFQSKDAYDFEIVKLLKESKVDFVILAGYLKWITPYFVESFRNKILNIHPSLLPSFKGLHGIEQAFDYGVKTTGVTVHFVDETEDGGAVILQEPVVIGEGETLEQLEEKIHKVEHILYPKAINLLVNNKLEITGRKVTLL